MKKRSIALLSLIITLSICGCATTSSEDKAVKDGSGKVRVSGDMTISTVDRKGF